MDNRRRRACLEILFHNVFIQKGWTPSQKTKIRVLRGILCQSFRGPVLWNVLLDTVKDAMNIQNFKYELKNKVITELKTTTFTKGTTQETRI